MTFAQVLRLSLAILATACTTAEPSAKQPHDGTVAYTLSPDLDATGKIQGLRVDIAFLGDADGVTDFRLPTGFASQGELWKLISELNVTGGVLSTGDHPAVQAIAHDPSAPITVSYRVRSGIDRAPTTTDEQPYVPWIFDDWFFFNGQTVFARLQRSPTDPASFTWKGPPDIVFGSDLEHMNSHAAKGTLRMIYQSTAIAGRDLRVLSDGPVRLGLRGTFAADDALLLESVTAILREERAFWGVPLDDPFFVAIGPMQPERGVRGGIGGTGQFDGYAIAMTRYTPLPIVMQIFAHETFHTWNLENNNVQPEDTWMHEGFTDYFAAILSLRAGVISIEGFADNWNDFLRSYAVSPARMRTNAEIVADRWSSHDAERMHYLRGALMAAVFDQRLREATRGAVTFDDVARKLRQHGFADSRPPARDQLIAIGAGHGLDLSADIIAHIDRGEPITLPENVFGRCLRAEQASVPVYDRGFDMDASARAGMVATGVRVGGPAHRAGLRDGMRLIEPIEGRLGDSTLESVWLVEVDGQQRTLRWMPAGDGVTSIQRIVRVPGTPSDLTQCGLG